MRQETYSKQYRRRIKTRNQRKRDIFGNISLALVLFGLCAAIVMWMTVMTCKALNHPAEQPITYAEHIARFGGENHDIQK